MEVRCGGKKTYPQLPTSYQSRLGLRDLLDGHDLRWGCCPAISNLPLTSNFRLPTNHESQLRN